VDVTMPQLGETVTEGTITRWFKQVGDSIAVDEPLFEVSTDKVDSEVPAPAAGVISEILVAEGDTVEVGARLAVISDSAGGAPSAPAPAAEEPAPPAELNLLPHRLPRPRRPPRPRLRLLRPPRPRRRPHPRHRRRPRRPPRSRRRPRT